MVDQVHKRGYECTVALGVAAAKTNGPWLEIFTFSGRRESVDLRKYRLALYDTRFGGWCDVLEHDSPDLPRTGEVRKALEVAGVEVLCLSGADFKWRGRRYMYAVGEKELDVLLDVNLGPSTVPTRSQKMRSKTDKNMLLAVWFLVFGSPVRKPIH
jgi:hypothetical protein